ncbi:NADH-ubiquinone oxidoreductase chain M [hydrothermal vent metagenome]|uniref:NADH-ubiquinone oxidoreductase chain M n=1 Tax=hydrothermal vent metagenome TaxID=652676 RepID=A0A1W1CBT9_9ZZZZ
MDNYLLSILIWIPILISLVLLQIKNDSIIRFIAVSTSLFVFILSLSLWKEFDSTTYLMQFVEQKSWIKSFNIEYYLGVDGISMPLIILSTFSTVLVLIGAWNMPRLNQYMASFLMMEGLIIGVFSALDSMLFYIFWEASLIPMLLIIGIWGGENRTYAAIKFFIYTFFGSVLMLLSFIYMFNIGDSFSILDFHSLALSKTEQSFIFWALFLAFAVKVPMFPVHTWLPDAHVQAPTGGSVILAAIMLKMGGYGFFRFSLPITPDASSLFAETIIILSLVAIVYISFIALVQKDMKKLIAYSSIAHMGFVTLGVFGIFSLVNHKEMALLGLEGGFMQMISHGFISAGMFFIIGVLYERMHSKKIADYGGVANKMPIFMFFVILFSMANAGLPGTSGFVGEFMVILSTMKINFWYALIAATTLIIGASYTLWMVKRVFWGNVTNANVEKLRDINGREFFIFTLLALTVLFFGIYPNLLLETIYPSIEHLFNQSISSKL